MSKTTIQNTNLNIRISKELKKQFLACTKTSEYGYSKILRMFIEDYVAKNTK